MVPIGPSLAASTSASTLWATASKEWVIPAKPKPGRKPKKESSVGPPAPKDDEDSESAGRRVQNRAAQRAFRERKQSQLAELQARLQSYEQGEIERNVALQNVAKKMKDENDELRKENQMLKEKIARLEWDTDSNDGDRKRNRENIVVMSPSMSPQGSIRNSNKRAKMEAETMDSPQGHFTSYSPPSTSVASSPDDGTTPSFSSAGHERRSGLFPTPPPSLTHMLNYPPSEPVPALDAQDSVDSFQCVLCSPEVPCVCREMDMEQAVADNNLSHISLKPEHDHSIMSPMDQPTQLAASTSSQINILENLPAYQAPVPIRRRMTGQSTNPVFSVTPISVPSSSAKCSGDPANCMACSDDAFGKAFCQAIGHSVNSTSPCIDCPVRANQSDNIVVGGCCGDITKCGSCGIAPMISSTNPPCSETSIPTDDAWRQLKSHPNVAFADLSLLAEVVARRSKCTGSRVVISPAPGSITPERSTLMAGHSRQGGSTALDHHSMLLTNPHGRYHQQQREQSPPPMLVPQEVLIECGRRRMREVNADGVREALRLLDSKFAHAR
ncbi:hypothetical protein DFJ58DRAFT_118347 [Suillus subalutaceus]|uniref:uncharacterized protein n=1 Tax=Suillus subalutaceus TaxID=48586 RepID=UPI001B885CA1|nr:uncharacterized protein DFJ58DRAFT_118347 [Suillus subalutaceus]KAG1867947.1 hypothetical protein DFJ58DRAFT_118347 [Suillus subalutaceus]